MQLIKQNFIQGSSPRRAFMIKKKLDNTGER